MKNIFLIVTLGLLMFSCSKNNEVTTEELNSKLNSDSEFLKDQIRDFQLDKQFNLSENVYNDFIAGIIFDEEGKIRGASIAGIQESLNEKELHLFLERFKVSVSGIVENSDFAAKADYPGYKPITGGCEKHQDFICFGSE